MSQPTSMHHDRSLTWKRSGSVDDRGQLDANGLCRMRALVSLNARGTSARRVQTVPTIASLFSCKYPVNPYRGLCRKLAHADASMQGILSPMNRFAYMISVLAVIGSVALTPTAAAAQPSQDGAGGGQQCVPTRPDSSFYEAGRVGSTTITVPESRCTTIAVSNIRDPRVRGDHCQTFLVAFLSTDGTDPTYTEPVNACSKSASKRIVLATNVPDGAVFFVLYQIDYIDPVIQTVRYKIWR